MSAATGNPSAVSADVHPILVHPLGGGLGVADLGEGVRADVRPPVREPVELAADSRDRVRRVLPGSDRHVPVRESHRAVPRVRDDDQVSDGVHPVVARDAERRVHLHRQLDLADREPRRDDRHAARCGEDEVRAELADAGHHRDGPVLPLERRDRDAAVEARAGVRERVGSERRQRVVEPVERALEEVEHGHVVPRRRQRRGSSPSR